MQNFQTPSFYSSFIQGSVVVEAIDDEIVSLHSLAESSEFRGLLKSSAIPSSDASSKSTYLS